MEEILQEAVAVWWAAYTSYLCEHCEHRLQRHWDGDRWLLLVPEGGYHAPDLLNDAELFAWQVVQAQYGWRGFGAKEAEAVADEILRLKETAIRTG